MLRKFSLLLFSVAIVLGALACDNKTASAETAKVSEAFQALREVPEPIIENPVLDASNLKILIVSHYTLNAKFLHYTRKNHRSFAKKHGYDYWVRNGNIDGGRFRDESNLFSKVHNLGLYWQKIAAIKDGLDRTDKNGKRTYDIVVWMDADAFFTNDSKSLEQYLTEIRESDFLDKDGQTFFLIAGDPADMVNAGVFLVKNNKKGRKFVDDIEAVFDNYKHLPWPEQIAIGDLIYQYTKVTPQGVSMTPYKQNPGLERVRDSKRMLPGTKILNQRVINAWYKPGGETGNYTWRSGDFICHFAGPYDKLKHMTRLFDCMDAQGGNTSGCEHDGIWTP